MQLPRGTFHSLKKDTAISSILGELTASEFTGHCSIVAGDLMASLVFDRGTCVLASLPPREGRAALDQLRESEGLEGSAELYTLSADQIALAREFNPRCLVEPAGGDQKSREPARPLPPKEPVKARATRSGSMDSGRHEGTTGKLQLPRGRFHSIVKNVALSALLDELKTSLFSGYGSITIGEESGFLVVEEGICLLASFPPERGSAALQILQTMVDDEVSAELYLLTPAQMQLALEFNRSYRVSVATSGVPVRMKLQKVREKPLKTERGVTSDEPPRVDEDFEEQIRVLESMDMKAMEDQFRTSLTDVIDRLQLTHLMPDEKTGDADDDGNNADGDTT